MLHTRTASIPLRIITGPGTTSTPTLPLSRISSVLQLRTANEKMRLVLPGQEAMEVLERAGTTKDECTERLKQMLADERVQLCVFRKRVLPENITLSDDPRQQGSFSFTYYITVGAETEEQRLVAQFR